MDHLEMIIRHGDDHGYDYDFSFFPFFTPLEWEKRVRRRRRTFDSLKGPSDRVKRVWCQVCLYFWVNKEFFGVLDRPEDV